METDSDVNPAFRLWKLSTGLEKDLALNNLVKRLEMFTRAICWQRLPDFKSEIDPLVNGIVWRAITKAPRFQGKSLFSTWFYRIAINECNRFLRNQKQLYETELEEMPTRPESIDARIDLLAILDGLEGQEHALLRMVAEGEDFTFIGTALGISRNAALVRWTRLKARLRDAG